MQDLHSTRLREELKRMLKTFPPQTSNIKWRIVEGDLHKYELLLPGPEDTPYSGGTWKITADLPQEYPFKPPITNFITPIYHPNVAVGGRMWEWGSNVCLSLVNWNNQGKLGGWKETLTLPTVVEHLMMMLEVYRTSDQGEFPEYLVDPRDPFNPEAGEQMLNDFELFYKTARQWTEQHAIGVTL